jgi:hypothetical protein
MVRPFFICWGLYLKNIKGNIASFIFTYYIINTLRCFVVHWFLFLFYRTIHRVFKKCMVGTFFGSFPIASWKLTLWKEICYFLICFKDELVKKVSMMLHALVSLFFVEPSKVVVAHNFAPYCHFWMFQCMLCSTRLAIPWWRRLCNNLWNRIVCGTCISWR